LIALTLPGNVVVRLPMRRRSDLPRGTVGLPIGVPGMPWFAAGVIAKLDRVSAA
jgi:hypothetical protein